jgi:hypothetical protein
MAEMIIMLRRDPNTGKQNIIIKLDSDPDALPIEHEQMHRALAEKVLGRKLKDDDQIIVERERRGGARRPRPADQRARAPEAREQGVDWRGADPPAAAGGRNARLFLFVDASSPQRERHP